MSKVVLKLCTTRLNFIKKQIRELDKALRACLTEDERQEKANLLSIPGIGRMSTATLLAETSGMTFVTAKQLTAYAGIAPEPHQSGKRQGQRSISKLGTARMRKVLYMAALTARSQGSFKTFYDRLSAANKAPKAALVAVARKLLVTAFAVVDRRCPFDPKYLCKLNPIP